MELLNKRPKGTRDTLPADVNKWQTVERLAKETAEVYGFREIRLPTFENTALFKRSVGDTTDVVQKEMYSVVAKASERGESDELTLRPEGTAGTVRAVLENGLLGGALPLKLFYLISCFRHEKPQAWRFREFHQFGAELFGSASPDADVELIAMAKAFLDRLGLENLTLYVNSIGCPECRADYNTALKAYFSANKEALCDTCKGRLVSNPMRILDCKSPDCGKICEGAPIILENLCAECATHFDSLKAGLGTLGIDFAVNPRLVRGLDYYTKTVFEFVANDAVSQSTVCGGGRYDGLVKLLGGAETPALGFAMGLERLILTMEGSGCGFVDAKPCNIFIAAMGDAAKAKATALAKQLRDEGFWAEVDIMGRGLKAQMKYADKLGAIFTLVLGDNELESAMAKLKDMKTGELTEIALNEHFIERFADLSLNEMFGNITGKFASAVGIPRE